jgi:hypothetical protein
MKKLIVALGILFGMTFAQCCVPCQTCVSGYVVMYPGTYVPNVCSNPCCCDCYNCYCYNCYCCDYYYYPGCIYGPVNCPTCCPSQSIIVNQMAN